MGDKLHQDMDSQERICYNDDTDPESDTGDNPAFLVCMSMVHPLSKRQELTQRGLRASCANEVMFFASGGKSAMIKRKQRA